jgi:hypothetical protein
VTAADSDAVGKEEGKPSAGVRKPLKRRVPIAAGACMRQERGESNHDPNDNAENCCRFLDGPRINADDDRRALLHERTPTVTGLSHPLHRDPSCPALTESSLHPVRSSSLASTDRPAKSRTLPSHTIGVRRITAYQKTGHGKFSWPRRDVP